MSDEDGGGGAGAGLEEEDMPVFCPPEQFSAIAKRILSSILGKLERLSLLKRIKRVLSKRPETRNVQDIDLLVKTTRHLPIFSCLSILEHRDLCHALRFHRAKEGEVLSVNGFLTDFYYVLSGSMSYSESTDQPGVKEKEAPVGTSGGVGRKRSCSRQFGRSSISGPSTRPKRGSIIKRSKAATVVPSLQDLDDINARSEGGSESAFSSSRLYSDDQNSGGDTFRTPRLSSSPLLDGFELEELPGYLYEGEEAEEDVTKRMKLEEDERKIELQKWFQTIDEDHSGAINVKELQVALRKLKITVTEDDLLNMMRLADTNMSGDVDFEEFVIVMEDGMGASTWWAQLLRKKELREVFNLIDKDGSGAIDLEEMGAALKWAGARIPMSELRVLFLEADDDGSGEIDYDEFSLIMETCMESPPQTKFENALMIQDLSSGCHVGELAVRSDLSDYGLLATLTATEPTDLLALDRYSFQAILERGFEGMMEEHVDLLRSTSLFAKLHRRQLRALATTLERVRMKRGEKLYQQGTLAESLHIVCDGELVILRDESNDTREVTEEERMHANTQAAIYSISHDHSSAQQIVCREADSENVSPRRDSRASPLHSVKHAASMLRRQHHTKAKLTEPKKAPAQKEVQMAVVGAGGILGEVALYQNCPHKSSGKVTSAQAEFAGIKRDELVRVLSLKGYEKLLQAHVAMLEEAHHVRHTRRRNSLRQMSMPQLTAPPWGFQEDKSGGHVALTPELRERRVKHEWQRQLQMFSPHVRNDPKHPANTSPGTSALLLMPPPGDEEQRMRTNSLSDSAEAVEDKTSAQKAPPEKRKVQRGGVGRSRHGVMSVEVLVPPRKPPGSSREHQCKELSVGIVKEGTLRDAHEFFQEMGHESLLEAGWDWRSAQKGRGGVGGAMSAEPVMMDTSSPLTADSPMYILPANVQQRQDPPRALSAMSLTAPALADPGNSEFLPIERRKPLTGGEHNNDLRPGPSPLPSHRTQIKEESEEYTGPVVTACAGAPVSPRESPRSLTQDSQHPLSTAPPMPSTPAVTVPPLWPAHSGMPRGRAQALGTSRMSTPEAAAAIAAVVSSTPCSDQHTATKIDLSKLSDAMQQNYSKEAPLEPDRATSSAGIPSESESADRAAATSSPSVSLSPKPAPTLLPLSSPRQASERGQRAQVAASPSPLPGDSPGESRVQLPAEAASMMNGVVLECYSHGRVYVSPFSRPLSSVVPLHPAGSSQSARHRSQVKSGRSGMTSVEPPELASKPLERPMFERSTPLSEIPANSPLTNFITEASTTPGSAAKRDDDLSAPSAGTSAVATVESPTHSIAGPSLFPSLPSKKPIKPTAAAIWKANSNINGYTFKSLRLPRSILSPSQAQPTDPVADPTSLKSLTSPNKVTCRF